MPAALDCWQVLGVERGASKAAISERYRELAMEHHPDRGGDSARMATINAAYREAATP